jgi:hypothetical protein
MNINKHEAFLNNLIDLILKNNMKYSSESTDGRINSINDENTARNLIISICNKIPHKGYEIDQSRDRNWYDIAFINPTDQDDILPINIKVSNLGTDNISGKEGIFYALTGKNPSKYTINSWDAFMKELFSNLDTAIDPAKDYYFLVFNKAKKNGIDCYWTSLKNLLELTPNGNNLPFQSNWTANRTRVKRNNVEAFKFLLNHLRNSHNKRASTSNDVIKYIDKIVSNITF